MNSDNFTSSFCQGEPLWDYELAWNTNSPRLTQCFQKTIPVWVPALFLWLFTPCDILSTIRKPRLLSVTIKPNSYNITRFILTGIIILTNLIKFSIDIFYFFNPVFDYSPSMAAVSASLIHVFTFALFGIFIYFHRVYGHHTSITAWIFMFLEFIFTLPLLYMYVKFFGDPAVLLDPYKTGLKAWQSFDLIIFYLHFTTISALFIMTCFADKRRVNQTSSVESLKCVNDRDRGLPMESFVPKNITTKIDVKECPQQSASYFSDLIYWWLDPLVYLGFRKTLVLDDLWDLNPEDKTVNIIPKFDYYWNGKKCITSGDELSDKICDNQKQKYFQKNGATTDPEEPEVVQFSKQCKEGGTIRATVGTFGLSLIATVVLKLIHDCLQFVSPQLLKIFIEFISESPKDEPLWHGIFIAICFFLISTVQSVVLNKYFYILFSIQMRIRSALISKIYRKSLELDNLSRKESTTGEIVNLMSVDAQKYVDLFPFINLVWSAPFQITLTIYFLWAELGPSVLAGLAVMILLMPLNAWISAYQRRLQIFQMKKKDERVKVINEVLNGMKVIKLYGWEVPFINKISMIRLDEIINLKRINYIAAITSFLWTCAPFMVSFVSFAIFILSSSDNVLDAKKAFVSLALFNLLRFPLTMLPPMVTSIVIASVSIKRLNKFLNSPQLEDYVHREDIDDDSIRITNGHFKWCVFSSDKKNKKKHINEGNEKEKKSLLESEINSNEKENNGKLSDWELKDINFRFKKGSLVAIVGRVGSGKSSLLSAILGNMERQDGRVSIDKHSRLAYVSQQAWIQNATLRENILFGSDFDALKYRNVVDFCALKSDIEMLPGGDLTEIGEKGINLSGGQKQRVAIARACYSDSNIVLMDDPLSAVDSHVAKHIFTNVISNKTGYLANCTRILVTNNISFLSEVDQVIVMNTGTMSEVGTFESLMRNSGKFAEFVKEYSVKEQDQQTEDDDVLENDDENQIEASNKRERTLSGKDSLTNLSIKSRSLTRKRSFIEELEKQKLIEAEKAETGNVKQSIYLAYFRSYTYFWLNIMLIGFVGMQILSIGSNIWLAIWSNDHKNSVTSNTTDINNELRNNRLIVYGLLGFFQAFFILIGSLAMAHGNINSSKTMHKNILEQIMKAPMSFFDTTPLGRIVNRFSKDIDTIDSTIPHNLRGWLLCFLQVISTFILITYAVPEFLIVAIIVLTIYYFIQKFYVATSRQLKRLESITRSPIYSHFGETLSGVFTIRAFNANEAFIKESNNLMDTNQRCFFPSFIANRWLELRLEFCGNLIVFFTTLFSVFSRESFQKQPGFAGLIITYALNVTATLNWLVRMTSDIETNIISVERIDEYCRIESEREWIRAINAEPHLSPDWPSNGEVKFDRYSVRYRKDLDLVLNNVSLHIKPHEKIGIVGRTGSGKSTTTLALFRILEGCGGNIQIDDIDISLIGLHELRSKLTIIPQDPVLFSGTIRSNLDPFETVSDTALWEALEHAHLKPYIQTLKEGLDYAVYENGKNLSLGQQQLICLARALLKKKDIRVIVLDEATAAVDLETDALIQQTIRSEFSDCTILTIAHRLNTIMDSDRVLVLDQGIIVEFDSPKNLISNKKSRFYSLAKDARIV